MALSFIQFLHPGKEHKPKGKDQHISWNEITNDHARKFIEIKGKYIDQNNQIEEPIWAWTEWEPESNLIKKLIKDTPQHPNYLWEPYWKDKEDFKKLHNTDPFIYEGFYYTDCRQKKKNKLKNLSIGSVIAFGSNVGKEWVLDTVFVVKNATQHNAENYKNKLSNLSPSGYEEITLRSTYSEMIENGTIKDRTFYSGATYNNRYEEMYSFFPCIPAGEDIGFKRPFIKLNNEYFSEKLNMNFKATVFNNDDIGRQKIYKIWENIKDQVEMQKLKIGIYAEMPPKR